MKKLSKEQKRTTSDFLANMAVAWFAAGVIGPLFSTRKLTENIIPGFWGMSASIILFAFSLLVFKGVRK